ncbi:MAG: hypothetical protein JRJ84_19660, partial [Deltaproteobacteria bacterium]|nr:hypothetical protein [Deltaproteobacteria bacterium]
MPNHSRFARVVPRVGATLDASNVMRRFMDPAGRAYASSTATRAIDAFLKDNDAALRLSDVSLARAAVKRGAGVHVRRSTQKLHGLPVLGAELRVVADKKRKAVLAAHNTLDYDTAGAPTPSAAQPFSALEGKAKAPLVGHHTHLQVSSSELAYLRFSERPPLVDFGPGAPDPAIFSAGQPTDGALHLVYDVRIDATGRRWVYRVVLDAVSGALLFVQSLTKSVTATLYAYYPDPVTSSDDGTLDASSTEADLKDEREEVQVEIDGPVGGKYRLQGDYFTAAELELPGFDPPEETWPTFKYDGTSEAFLSANAYYWLDIYARLLLSL